MYSLLYNQWMGVAAKYIKFTGHNFALSQTAPISMSLLHAEPKVRIKMADCVQDTRRSPAGNQNFQTPNHKNSTHCRREISLHEKCLLWLAGRHSVFHRVAPALKSVQYMFSWAAFDQVKTRDLRYWHLFHWAQARSSSPALKEWHPSRRIACLTGRQDCRDAGILSCQHTQVRNNLPMLLIR